MLETVAFTVGDLPEWASELLEHSRVGHLGLIDDRDRPRVLPVTFVVFEDDVFSAVDEKPKRVRAEDVARVRYLRRRPEASLTVDVYDDDWSRLAWVQLLGRVEITDAAAHPEALGALCEKYAPYRERPPPGPLLRLAPERAVWWRASDPASPRSTGRPRPNHSLQEPG
jgi:PPOX class probable F420-dependent enzyme